MGQWRIQTFAKLAPFLQILASMPPLADHPGSAPVGHDNLGVVCGMDTFGSCFALTMCKTYFEVIYRGL